ncbi:MAG: MBL fold metallo-hydrolase [Tropicimonas sp.]|uniref:MBL fold metallo-hydrolase n=1 Tax=Tropicimonas sp. TaxID=2067044 RepID=UPI003A84BDAE
MPASPIWLAPELRRVQAPNPSPMTHRGTNSYILGQGDVAVIDPGPALPEHLDALLDALGPGERVSHILVTHCHLDHSALAPALAARTGAPVCAFGSHDEGRSGIMARLAAEGGLGGGEGIDRAFTPDIRLRDGSRLAGENWQVEVLHTPGHSAGHLCFDWNGMLFSGDHVMGWASSLISPPDGDLGAFMASCRRLRARPLTICHPGHGDPVTAPHARIDWLIAHRLEREAQILDLLSRGPSTLHILTTAIYGATPAALQPAARRNVLAHLIDLEERNRLRIRSFPDGTVTLTC